MGYAIIFILLLAVIIIVNPVFKNISSKKHSEYDYDHEENESVKLRNDLKYRNLPCNINYVHVDDSKKNDV